MPNMKPRDSRARHAWAEGTWCLLLLLLLAVSIAVRLAFAASKGLDSWPANDNRLYFEAGLGLVEGRTLPTRWPPLLPLLNALVISIFGASPLAAKILVLSFGSAIPLLTALVAARIAGQRVGLVAGILAAFDGYLVVASNSAMTEPLYTTFLLLLLLALSDPTTLPPPWRALGLGVLAGLPLGAASLARPTGSSNLAAVVAVMLVVAPLRRRLLAWLSGLALGVALFVLPWGLYTHATAHAWVFTTTGAGTTLLGGNCQEALDRRESWLPAIECGVLSEDELARVATAGEVERDRILMDVALRDLATHPDRVPRLLLRKFASFWGWGNEGWSGSTLARASLLAFTALLPFTGLGAARLWSLPRPGSRHLVAMSLAFIAVTLAISLVFVSGHRARVSVEPLLLIFAARGLVPRDRAGANGGRLGPSSRR